MFHLSVFSTILLILAVFALIIICVIAIKSYMEKKDSSHYEQDSMLIYGFGKEEKKASSSSMLKDVPKKLWNDFCGLFANLFNISSKKQNASNYTNSEEQTMLANIQKDEEGFGSEENKYDEAVYDNVAKDDGTDTSERITNNENKGSQEESGAAGNGTANEANAPEANEEIKANQENSEPEKTITEENQPENNAKEPDLASLFAMPEKNNGENVQGSQEAEKTDSPEQNRDSAAVIDSFDEIRRKYLENKKSSKKQGRKKRKKTTEAPMLSEEKASEILVILDDLVSDCDSLDKSKIKGRLSFIDKTVNNNKEG